MEKLTMKKIEVQEKAIDKLYKSYLAAVAKFHESKFKIKRFGITPNGKIIDAVDAYEQGLINKKEMKEARSTYDSCHKLLLLK